MRTFRRVALLLALSLAANAAQAEAPDGVVSLTESETETLAGADLPTSPLTASLQADPGPVLDPAAPVAADVALLEENTSLTGSVATASVPAGSYPTPSDRMASVVSALSDTAEGADAPADTGSPSALSTNVSPAETGLGPLGGGGGVGGNGFLGYSPIPNQGGVVAGSAVPSDLNSDVTSDVTTVPEPASMLLIAVGIGLLFATRRWQAHPARS